MIDGFRVVAVVIGRLDHVDIVSEGTLPERNEEKIDTIHALQIRMHNELSPKIPSVFKIHIETAHRLITRSERLAFGIS